MLNLKEKRSLEIKHDDFSLKAFTMDLVGPRYLSWLRDPEVNRFLIGADANITVDAARSYCQALLESEKDIFLGIFLNPGGQHIGNVRLGPINSDEQVGKFSIMIGEKSFHGQGMGTEVFRSCMKYYFETVGVNRICVDVIEDHHAAVRIYKKCKLKVKDRDRRQCWLDGRFQTIVSMYIDKMPEEQ